MRPAGKPRAGAFTLIEIMVALGIFMLVMAAIYSTWTAIIRSSRAVQEAAARVQRERITIQTLEQAITSAHSFLSDGQYYSFDMENKSASTLSFVARLPRSFLGSGAFGDFSMRRITFSLEGGKLVMRQCPILMQMDEDQQNHPMELAKDVKTFKVEAYDVLTGKWTDEWLETNQIPTNLRISVEFSPPGGDPYARAVDGFVLSVCPFSKAVEAIWQSPNSGGPASGLPPGLGQPGTPPGAQPGNPPGANVPGGLPNPAFRSQ
jgi:type II secretion system protein J